MSLILLLNGHGPGVSMGSDVGLGWGSSASALEFSLPEDGGRLHYALPASSRLHFSLGENDPSLRLHYTGIGRLHWTTAPDDDD